MLNILIVITWSAALFLLYHVGKKRGYHEGYVDGVLKIKSCQCEQKMSQFDYDAGWEEGYQKGHSDGMDHALSSIEE